MKKYQSRLFCFSPPVMIATSITETGLLLYTLWRYKLNRLTRVAVTMLFFLALFQLSEYNVCGGAGVSAATWSRIGFVAISLLPALGIHLIEIIGNNPWRWLKWIAYATAAVWVYLFTFSMRAFGTHVCAGNYVIFQLHSHYGGWYFAYYYSWLFIGIGLALWLAYRAKSQATRETLVLQVFGYIFFLLPTAVVNTVSPSTISGLPSVMCGFAVLYAITLVFGILPISRMGAGKPAVSPKLKTKA